MKRRVAALLISMLTIMPALAADRWQLVHAGQLLDQPGKPARGAATLLLGDDQVEAVLDGHPSRRLQMRGALRGRVAHARHDAQGESRTRA